MPGIAEAITRHPPFLKNFFTLPSAAFLFINQDPRSYNSKSRMTAL